MNENLDLLSLTTELIVLFVLAFGFCHDARVRYDSEHRSERVRFMQGQLSEHPLAELIREINNTGLSGALRVSHDRAKVVVYFETGDLLFAASNLRAHRLREVLKRSGIADENLHQYPETI